MRPQRLKRGARGPDNTVENGIRCKRAREAKRGLMAEGRSRRKSLRAPVYLDVRCDLDSGDFLKGKIINLGTEGVFVRSTHSFSIGDYLTMEFLLPGTLSSICQEGEVVWIRSYDDIEFEGEPIHAAGIKFHTLEEPYLALILDVTLKMLDTDELVQSEGILRILDDIRNLPSLDRLRAYNILIKKGSGPAL